jgi:uncharacterized protein (DUF4415 family)
MKSTSNRAGEREAIREKTLARIRADIASTSEAEDEAITRAAESDPDNLPNRLPTRTARPPAALREAVTIRLDRDVLAYFKAAGEGWQSRINEVLRKAARLE